jgi:hypothetical protein
VIITIDTASVETWCIWLWDVVFLTEGRSVIFTGKDLAVETPQLRSTLMAILGTLTWEHLSEQVPDPKP